jgi:hypothetical protein
MMQTANRKHEVEVKQASIRMLPSFRLGSQKVKAGGWTRRRVTGIPARAIDATLRHFDASVVDSEHHDWRTYRKNNTTLTHTQHGRNTMTCTSRFFDHG